MTKENELKAYKFERQQIVERLERIFDFVNAFTPEQDVSLIEARQTVALNSFKEFSAVQACIETNTNQANLAAEAKERVSFEVNYYATIAKINSLLKINAKAQSLTNNQTQKSTPQSVEPKNKITLPVIKLPEFSGSYTEWLSFRDTFSSVIHENAALSDVEKFHYLRATLTGEALRAIESYAVSSSNYNSAWATLLKRYENKRLIIHAHLRNLINFPKINKSSYDSLRRLINDVTTNLESLKVLKLPIDQWDAILVSLITDKLDYLTNREWQAKLTDELPKFNDLIQFLESRCRYFEAISSNPNHSTPSTSNTTKLKFQNQLKPFKSTSANYAVSSSKSALCAMCSKGNHFIHQCTKFLNLPVTNRIEHVKNVKLCENCLRANHGTASCKSNSTCRDCRAKHNTLLHEEQPVQISNNNLCNFNATNNYSEVILSTAIVYIMDYQGNWQECRLLLDSGSQSNFITKSLCKKLNLKITATNHRFTGINMFVGNVSETVEVLIKSKYTKYSAKINCLVLSKVTADLPLVSFPIDSLEIPSNINLADNNFNESDKIDMLLGAQIFLDLLKIGKISLNPHKICLQNTQFGWIIGGQINLNQTPKISNCNIAITNDDFRDLSKQATQFWKVEDIDFYNTSKPLSPQEAMCEEHFTKTCVRDEAGRFVVELPFKDDNNIQLGNSIEIAKKRFFNLERKLNNNDELRKGYVEFMREYQNLGHMEKVPNNEKLNLKAHYIPHHAVNKSNKLRVVFDASAKTKNGPSLNQNLLTGPTIQDDLLAIIIRFRTYEFVFNCDIKKMYRQIKISPKHADYQRILWRENINEPLETFRLQAVTYGVTSSPFLATRCLLQLATEFSNIYPEGSKVIARDLYVDDVITGSDSIEEAIKLKEEIIIILNSGGFDLAKWASNEPRLLPKINNSDNDNYTQTINLDKNGETKTLGLYWNCSDDSLKYKVQILEPSNELTKRTILSTICKIFDPLGLVNPIIVRTKIFLQHLWRIQLDWDQPVPENTANLWSQIINDLKQLNEIKIPRKVKMQNPINIQLHGFADASEKAYGFYVRSTNKNGEVQTQLLMAKSRVAPIKTITIPRLELLAALLLAQVANRIQKTINIQFNDTYLWTDSTIIVLTWISQSPCKWKTFVSNKVSEIQSLTLTLIGIT